MPKLLDFEGLAMSAKVAEERSYAGAARSMDVSVATASRLERQRAVADDGDLDGAELEAVEARLRCLPLGAHG
jgi:hypothetical protein